MSYLVKAELKVMIMDAEAGSYKDASRGVTDCF
jgi:hypothetical protein